PLIRRPRPPMFAKFLQSFLPVVAFFQDDHMQTKLHTSALRRRQARRVERWLVAGWILIAVKCAALWWLIETYQVPIHPLWLVIPSVVFGALATVLYIWRD